MTTLNIPDLMAKARKATPGPLKLDRYHHGGGRMYCEDPRTLVMDAYHEGDREFYAAASPSVIIELCERVTRYEQALREIAEPEGMGPHRPSEVRIKQIARDALAGKAVGG